MPDDSLVLRDPGVPTTLGELSALKGEALEIIETRATILHTLRVAAIRATHPEDWLLFKSPAEQGGQIVAYLQDCGCDRVRDLFGIEVFDITPPQRIAGTEAGAFHYVIVGSGRCKFTRQDVENMEGGRSSTDDFCKDKKGPDLELAVRKAARANLDGNITRELAGLKSVPIEELSRAWEGSAKRVEACRHGRGFGSRTERLGGAAEGVPEVAPPICPHCQTPGAYRAAKGDRAAFYGCPNYTKHPQQKFIVPADAWVKRQQEAAAKQAAADPVCKTCNVARSAHAQADHDFDGD